jgi:hypothetical protein
MKLFLTYVFLLLSAPILAQSVQSFDIVSFSLAPTWKKEAQQDWLAYRVENPAKKTYARILIYPSLPSSGNPETDFQKEWNDLIVSNYKPGQTIEESLSDYKEGWKAKIRVAPFVHNQVNQAIILLMMTDGKKKMSYVFLTNTEDFQKDFEDFGSSLSFASAPVQTPTAASPPQVSSPPAQVSTPKAPVQIDQKLVGKWNRSASVSPLFASPAEWGTSGYTTCRYEFFGDGTYQYTERNFSYSFVSIIVVKENGHYDANGGVLTISPAQSLVEKYSKKNGVDELGNLLESKGRVLEKVSYRYQFHFFEGIGEWNLVLQADRPTQRDGNFSSNTTFPNAWYFDQRFTDKNLLK